MAYRAYTRKHIDRLPQLQNLPAADREAMKVVSAVFPFRVNDYVVEQLIDWSRVPEDPIFQLTFPQPGMLDPDDFSRMVDLVRSGSSAKTVAAAARDIQLSLNPHPAADRVISDQTQQPSSGQHTRNGNEEERQRTT